MRVKRWIAALLCVLMVIPMAMTVTAEGTTDPDTPTSSDKPTSSTPTKTEKEPTSTEKEPTKPTAGQPVKVSTSMTIAYEHRTITVRVTDANGKPVPQAPVAVSVDGDPTIVKTNNSGVATLTVSADPQEVRASMSEFQTEAFIYGGSQASVTLGTSPTAALPVTGGGETTAPPVTEAPPTQAPFTLPPTTKSTNRPLTTTDPEEGDVTVIEIVTVTGTTVAAAEEEESDEPHFSKGLALGLIIFGGLLLAGAIVLLCVFLFRRPHDPDEDEEFDEEYPDGEYSEEEYPDGYDEGDAGADEDPEDTDAASDSSISLEDLFRK